MSVVGWIGDHVRQNPYIDLTPVFQDYAKHLASITPSNTPTSSDEPVSIVATEPVANEPMATEPVANEPMATEPVATKPMADSNVVTEQNGESTAGAAAALDQSSREDDQAGSSETTTGECLVSYYTSLCCSSVQISSTLRMT